MSMLLLLGHKSNEDLLLWYLDSHLRVSVLLPLSFFLTFFWVSELTDLVRDSQLVFYHLPPPLYALFSHAQCKLSISQLYVLNFKNSTFNTHNSDNNFGRCRKKNKISKIEPIAPECFCYLSVSASFLQS